MSKEEVIKELIEEMSQCGMFVGRYDARNGSPQFMHGVNMVMEYLAYKVSEEYGDAFSDKFVKNLIESEKSC